MHRSNLAIFLFVFTVGLIAAGWWFFVADEAQQSSDVEVVAEVEKAAALSGRVIDTSGRPVGDAQIFAGEATTKADENGHFSFAELPAEEISIDAVADGYTRPGIGALGRFVVDLADEKPVTGLKVVMSRSASISGQVVADGNGVAGAGISLSYLFAEGLDGKSLDPFINSSITLSGDDGSFELSNIAPGRLQIMVDSDNYPFGESREYYFRPGQHREGIVIDLAPSGRIYGSVTTEDGHPVAAAMSLTPVGEDRRIRNIYANDDGHYSLSDLRSGSYTLLVEAEGLRPETSGRITIRDNGEVEKNFVLAVPQGLIGRVIEPDGSPVGGAHIQVRSGDDERRLRAHGDGHFEWPDAPPGNWTAVASSPGHQASAPTPIRHNEEITIEVVAGGHITGRVITPDGQRVSSYQVGISYMENDDDIVYQARQMPSTSGDSDGSFEMGPLRSGRYRLMITADGYAPATTDPIRVSPGTRSGPITVQLEENSSIAGVVLDADTGEPVEGVRVAFSMRLPSGRPPMTRTDAEGRYQLDGLPSGRSTVRLIHDMYIFELIGGLEIPSGGHRDFNFEIEPIGEGQQPGQNIQGIGASLRPVDGGFRVASAFDSSPAVAAGIRDDDVITAVDGRSVDELTLDQVVELIRGEPGSAVSLDVNRSGRGTRSIDVDRQRVFIPIDREVR